MSEGFAGTGTLIRLAVRRDRLILPAWIAVFVVMAAFSADATIELYPDATSRIRAAEAINGTPSLVALYGRIYDVTSLGAIAMIKMGGMGSLLLAVFAFMFVIRHTRADEETGRLELLVGGVVGSHGPLAAALAVAAGGALAVGALTAVSLAAVGLPWSGSVAFGLAWSATGLVFAAVGAVAAQVTSSARIARGLATAALAGAYLLRAVGDTNGAAEPSWLTWSSPIGWAQQVRPFAGDRWGALLGLGVFAAATVTVAFVLNGRRDFAAGLLPDRPGRSDASPQLRSPSALAWRLERGTILGWAIGFGLLGSVLGSIANDLGGLLDSPQAKEMITRLGGVESLTDAFIAAELGFMGIFGAAFGIQAALRMHAEETSLRLDPVLAAGVHRLRWMGSHLSVALLGPVVLALVFGVAVGGAGTAQTGDVGDLGAALVGALVQVPAMWVVTGLVVAAYGIAPRLAPAGWAVLVGFLLVGEVGALVDLPSWAMDFSPFTHVPRLPGGDFRAAPLLWLTGLAAALVAAGMVGFRRRDLNER